MYSSGYSQVKKGNQLNSYLVKEILEATPQQLLIKIFDFAIVNCQKHNIEKTNKALQELINSLKFEGDDNVKQISLGLLKLYQFCQEEIRKQNYDIVYKILVDLRNSWLSAFKL